MWVDFIAFQMAAGLPSYQVIVHLLLAFLENLHQNSIAPAQLHNYLTAIRALHIVHGLDTIAFRDERLPLFLKALKINAPLKPIIPAHFSLLLFNQCNQFAFPVTLFLGTRGSFAVFTMVQNNAE